MDKLFMKNIKEAWSATQFPMDEITHYAQVLGVEEARKGIISLSLVLLFLFSMEIMFFYSFGFDKSYLYTATLLAMLVVPYVLYRVFPPEVKRTPEAPRAAARELGVSASVAGALMRELIAYALTDQEREYLEYSAGHYVRLAERHRGVTG